MSAAATTHFEKDLISSISSLLQSGIDEPPSSSKSSSPSNDSSCFLSSRNHNGRLLALANHNSVKISYIGGGGGGGVSVGGGKTGGLKGLSQSSAFAASTSKSAVGIKTSNLSKSSDKGLKSWWVGKSIYGGSSVEGEQDTSSGSRIVKIAWHPLSSTNSHLLVLSSNGILRMFNVSVDLEEAEQTFYVTRTLGDHMQHQQMKPSKASKSFGPNLEEYEAVSFSLGSYADVACGWSCCTVYALLASGDVVSLCPVLPNEFSVSRDWIRETLQWSRDEWAALDGEGVDEDTGHGGSDTKQYYWMCRYLEEIMGIDENGNASSATGKEDEEGGGGGHIALEGDVFYRPFRQFSLGRSGACLFSPSCSVLEATSSRDVTPGAQDIALISTKTGIPILTLLVDNVLLVGSLLSPPCPFWLFDQYQEEYCPVVTLFEVLSLSPEGGNGHDAIVEIVKDDIVPDTLFVKFPNLVYQVQLELYKYLSEFASLVEKMDRCPPSLLKKLVQSRNSQQHITQFVVLPDMPHSAAPAAAGVSFLCIASDGGRVSDVVYPMQHSILSDTDSITSNGQEGKEQPLPSLPAFNYNLLNNHPLVLSAGSSTPSTKKAYPDFIDEKSIKKIAEDISATRAKIKAVLESFDKLNQRVKELEHHSSLQKLVLETAEKSLSTTLTHDRLDKQRKRFERIKTKQREQSSKLVGVLDLLFDMTQPNLSAAEIQWCQDLGQLYKQFECFYGPKLLELQVKAKQVQEKLSIDESSKNTSLHTVPEMLGTRQVRDIKQSLEFEVRELKSLKQKVDKLHIVSDSLEDKMKMTV